MTDQRDTAQRVLLFGGTFDPPHRGHLELAAHVRDTLGFDRVIFVPAGQNPLKTDRPTPATHRLAMLRRALEGCRAMEVSTVELDRAGPSFWVDTLRKLRLALGPETKLHFLIGADAALAFDRWRDHGMILELAEPLVLLRPPWTRDAFVLELLSRYGDEVGTRWARRIVDAPLIDISASAIRQALRDGADVGDAVPAPVLAYIREHDVYA
jgi:nicotinate-nucleotide adenylyltransferase